MNSRQRKTLEAIFASPTPRTMVFRAVESLLKALGCSVFEGEGSRVLFTMRGIDWVTHRPHPGKEAKPYQIREARDYLRALGVEP